MDDDAVMAKGGFMGATGVGAAIGMGIGVTILIIGIGLAIINMDAANEMTPSERLIYDEKYDNYNDQTMLGFIILAIGAGVVVASAGVGAYAKSSSRKGP